MKVRKLLEIQSTFEDRKIPCDMNGELNKHYSESKEKEIDILDMDLIHLVRSYSKTINGNNTIKVQKQNISYNVDNILNNVTFIKKILDE